MTKRRILISILIIFVLIQLIKVDKSNPPLDPRKDFITLTKPPAEIVLLLKNSCYDCHSDETTYPWYFSIAPISWWTKHHVNEGKHHLNFSTWSDYPAAKQAHKLDECYTEIAEGEMPLSSYTLVHGSAALTAEQQTALLNWLQTLGAEKE